MLSFQAVEKAHEALRNPVPLADIQKMITEGKGMLIGGIRTPVETMEDFKALNDFALKPENVRLAVSILYIKILPLVIVIRIRLVWNLAFKFSVVLKHSRFCFNLDRLPC